MSKEAADKVFDAQDEAFICYCWLQILDRDGIPNKTKGSTVTAPVQLLSGPSADPVIMEALFDSSDPLFYLEVRNEDQFYLHGQFWMDGAKHSDDKVFCTVTPVLTQSLHKAMESSGTQRFDMKAICPFLLGSTSRPIKVVGNAVEKKFTTKLAGVRLEVPRKDWEEFKAHRVRLWRAGKNWAGADEKKDDKDKDKKEGEESGDQKMQE